MLISYLQMTRLLLNDTTFAVYNDDDLITYVNNARLQVAAQGACIRVYANLPLVTGQQQYGFAALTNLGTGVAGAYHIRQLWYQVLGATGTRWVASRPFEWFSIYALNVTVPQSGTPKTWSQFGQGEAGSIFIDPLPDNDYTCNVDVLGVPVSLADEATPEAIPAIWTLAVPFYAAWLGYMSLQRQSDADLMFKRFGEQMALARNAANPDLLPENWSQSPDPMMPNRLGIQPARAQG